MVITQLIICSQKVSGIAIKGAVWIGLLEHQINCPNNAFYCPLGVPATFEHLKADFAGLKVNVRMEDSRLEVEDWRIDRVGSRYGDFYLEFIKAAL